MCLLLFCSFADKNTFQDSYQPSITWEYAKVLEKVLDFCVTETGNPDYTA